MLLTDKVAIVTGAASGIGKEIAALFVKEGGKVLIADLNGDAAAATAKALDSSGGKVSAVAMDATQESQVNAAVQKAIDTWGRVDILVANAGIQIVYPVQEFPMDKWEKLIKTNLTGPFLITKAVLPHMQKQKGGSIIYMGSVHSKVPSPLKVAYVAAKHGLLGLARVVAKEGAAFGVRTNVICPGFVRTPLVDKQIPEQAKELGISEEEVVQKYMLHETVDGQFTTVDDVAQVALFFAAFKSNALTGQSLIVSHGWFME